MNELWFAVLGGLMLVFASTLGGAVSMLDQPADAVWSPDTPSLDNPPTSMAAGTATVGEQTYESVQAAVDAADAGDHVTLQGAFTEQITVDTPNVTISGEGAAQIDGNDQGTVIYVTAPHVTIEGIWITNSGTDRSDEDAGLRWSGADGHLEDVHLRNVLFGIWVESAPNVTIAHSTIVGDEAIPRSERGNAVHLFEADGATVHNNAITQVRDGIYYQWSSGVDATDNQLWDLRYGVHYMYSDDNRLEGNLAFRNNVGFALMVSENLTIVNNTAVDNRHGPSQHGILVKDIDHSEIRGNDLVGNGNGLFVYHSQDNHFEDNLLLENAVGMQFTAGSSGETVVNNSFIHNDHQVIATQTATRSSWNDSTYGNYWSDARTIDLRGDGTSDVRHWPAGTVEQLLQEEPAAAVFVESPAFEAVRLAESSFPVIEGIGVVDHHPLTESPHDHWEAYYGHHN